MAQGDVAFSPAPPPDTTGRKQDVRGNGREVTQFKKGVSGNPAGRPKGARNRLSEEFLETLHKDFSTHGPEAIATVRKTDPVAYLNVIIRLLPKDIGAREDDGAFVKLLEIISASAVGSPGMPNSD